ncbi:MAG: hypothetical protein EA412_03805 [Chitinophagaceae bacterium]|nr:MAG: hypothetical protein EA412_03805 [Chitinophagaceae bacterium]
MYLYKNYFIIICLAFLFVSCIKEDDEEDAEEEIIATFNLSGAGIGGLYEGDNTLIGIHYNEEDESEASTNWSTTPPQGEGTFWRLEFGRVDKPRLDLDPGTYIIGNVDDLANGDADLMVAFQHHSNPQGFPFLWGALGDASGTLVVTHEIGEYAYGTFEFTASDNNIDGTLDQPPLDDIIVTNGKFRAYKKAFVFQ